MAGGLQDLDSSPCQYINALWNQLKMVNLSQKLATFQLALSTVFSNILQLQLTGHIHPTKPL